MVGKKVNRLGKKINWRCPLRTYDQFCGLSKALDVVGGRWTLLVVRELLLGPRRFGELRDALPGVANNLLADRLRELEAADLIKRREHGEGIQRYELTERGQALDEVVFALMRWGADEMQPRPGELFRPEWLALVLRAYLPRQVPPDAAVRARVVLGPHTTLTLDTTVNPTVVRASAPTADEDVVLEADPHALLAVASGAEPFAVARQRGDLTVRGNRAAAGRLARLFATVSPR